MTLLWQSFLMEASGASTYPVTGDTNYGILKPMHVCCVVLHFNFTIKFGTHHR